ncbi:MAG: glycosyltransferase family 2 protein [Gemmatimonadaceae bacterium]|nr:glycosyltransferase family 2 protein [Gemmatimonadaceae bacterium]
MDPIGTQHARPHVSVVVPAFNEEMHVAATMLALATHLEDTWPGDYEIIVVDDGSSDGTFEAAMAVAEVVDRCTVVTSARNRGKGYALRRGFEVSRGTYVAFIDADGEIAVADVIPLLQHAERGVSVVVGRRRWNSPRPALRRIGSALLSLLAHTAFRLPVSESQAGAKAFVRGDVAHDVRACREEGFLFDLELLMRANQRRLPIANVEVTTTVVRPCRIGFANGVHEALALSRLWWRFGVSRSMPVRPAASNGRHAARASSAPIEDVVI